MCCISDSVGTQTASDKTRVGNEAREEGASRLGRRGRREGGTTYLGHGSALSLLNVPKDANPIFFARSMDAGGREGRDAENGGGRVGTHASPSLDITMTRSFWLTKRKASVGFAASACGTAGEYNFETEAEEHPRLMDAIAPARAKESELEQKTGGLQTSCNL